MKKHYQKPYTDCHTILSGNLLLKGSLQKDKGGGDDEAEAQKRSWFNDYDFTNGDETFKSGSFDNGQ